MVYAALEWVNRINKRLSYIWGDYNPPSNVIMMIRLYLRAISDSITNSFKLTIMLKKE